MHFQLLFVKILGFMKTSNILKKVISVVFGFVLLFCNVTSVNATDGNPYTGGWSNCAYGAWELVYETNGIMLPALGYSTNWYQNAANLGYAVGPTPAANSVGVWVGHVAYVADYDGAGSIYVREGGYKGGYHEEWTNAFGARYGEELIGYIYLGEIPDPSIATYRQMEQSGEAENMDPSLVTYYESLQQTQPRIVKAVAQESQSQIKDDETVVRYDDANQQCVLKTEEQLAIQEVKQENKSVSKKR